MAGKGPQLRKGANLVAYWNNYDNIFRKEEIVHSKNKKNVAKRDKRQITRKININES